ncbi:NADH-dependent alcohol dehydrogenase [Halobacillus halophilus]|uniref:Alcohol dehydrogenase n=1 Tax=Halobacillus halophilus (strain ATCC 35676 / DSM 2266 / JCM 20832 / KCTC 3685 / LMG 17431 / NBRC 102448 / NCIMB 2269) TaxID=866895 RepID=I0JQ07_HALH3|nr:iron-containing alcohol dehydrogenase [Halobacillus halophilus]ASF40246.1 NADH-dependent alcohol dehydrogenase [Halobacillus halophilus]CCG46227.1 alcohol dehydrogenase [Halobacillus halophilus DSM 2266]
MDTFTFYNPTKLIFGKDQVTQLPSQLPEGTKKVLLVYGGGSIKKNGVYDQVVEQLNQAAVEILELSGVEPNPKLTTVKKGVEICKREGVDFLIAVGGGSVIDCTKTIATGAKYEGDPWDLVTRKEKPEDAIPFGTVLTLAATGSEMNAGSVITNWETNEKYGWGAPPYTNPLFSILDPQYTVSVPKDQTVYGIVDMMTHMLEQYFHNPTQSPVQDEMIEGVLRTVVNTAPKLLDNPESYEHRETILYSGTIALNGMLQMGYRGDWASHNIEHAVSAVYDIPHAGGLAILFPNWMKHNLDVNPDRFKQLAVKVFGVTTEGKSSREVGEEGIEALRTFWSSLGAPETLDYYGINDEKFDVITDRAMKRGPFGNFNQLESEDVVQILEMSK